VRAHTGASSNSLTMHSRGVAREDLADEDLAVVLWAIYGILDVSPAGCAGNAWRRHLDFVLAGFTDRPATKPQRALSAGKMTQIIRSSPASRLGRDL
jgi:hypothetical protein